MSSIQQFSGAHQMLGGGAPPVHIGVKLTGAALVAGAAATGVAAGMDAVHDQLKGHVPDWAPSAAYIGGGLAGVTGLVALSTHPGSGIALLGLASSLGTAAMLSGDLVAHPKSVQMKTVGDQGAPYQAGEPHFGEKNLWVISGGVAAAVGLVSALITRNVGGSGGAALANAAKAAAVPLAIGGFFEWQVYPEAHAAKSIALPAATGAKLPPVHEPAIRSGGTVHQTFTDNGKKFTNSQEITLDKAVGPPSGFATIDDAAMAARQYGVEDTASQNGGPNYMPMAIVKVGNRYTVHPPANLAPVEKLWSEYYNGDPVISGAPKEIVAYVHGDKLYRPTGKGDIALYNTMPKDPSPAEVGDYDAYVGGYRDGTVFAQMRVERGNLPQSPVLFRSTPVGNIASGYEHLGEARGVAEQTDGDQTITRIGTRYYLNDVQIVLGDKSVTGSPDDWHLDGRVFGMDTVHSGRGVVAVEREGQWLVNGGDGQFVSPLPAPAK